MNTPDERHDLIRDFRRELQLRLPDHGIAIICVPNIALNSGSGPGYLSTNMQAEKAALCLAVVGEELLSVAKRGAQNA